MVLDDYLLAQKSNKSKINERPTNGNYIFADVLDRMAAFIVDLFLIFIPIMKLISAPFNTSIYDLKYLGQLDQLDIHRLWIVGLYVLCYLLYQSFFLSKYGATPGKKIFKIKVIVLFTRETPGVFSSIIRTVFILFEVMMFPVTLFMFLTHKDRRMLHDRVVDTITVSTKANLVKSHPVEISYVKAMYTSFLLMYFMLAIAPVFMGGSFESVAKNKTPDKCYKLESYNTQEFSKYVSTFLAGKQSLDCFDANASLALDIKETREQGYVAKFLSIKKANGSFKLLKSYKDRICNTSSIACKVADHMLYGKRSKVKVEKLYTQIHRASKSPFNVWLLGKMLKENNYKMVSRFSKRAAIDSSIKDFYGAAKVKLLWAFKDRSKSTRLANKLFKGTSSVVTTELAQWMCYKKLNVSCALAEAPSCEKFLKGFLSNPSTPMSELTYIKTAECNAQGEELGQVYSDTSKLVENVNSKILLYALNAFDNGEFEKSFGHLKTLLTSETSDDNYKKEAALRMINMSLNQEQWSEVYAWWLSAHHSLEWEQVGVALLAKNNKFGTFDVAAKISVSLEGYLNQTPGVLQQMIIAHYYAGNKLKAGQIYKGFKKSAPLRGTASVEKLFKEAEDQLKKGGHK